MFYRKLSNEELKKFPYPNLMAEIIENHYSICTIGTHMGIGDHCQEDDSGVWGRLKGNIEINCLEAIGLASLFGVKMEYLFSHELETMSGMPKAYWRWLDTNERREREEKARKMREEIMRELRKKPYLLGFIKEMLTVSEAESLEIICLLNGLRDKNGCAAA